MQHKHLFGCVVLPLCDVRKQTGASNEKILAKYFKYHFLLSKIVSELLKAYICKLIHIDLFGVFSGKFRPQKTLGIRSLSVEFASC